MHPTRRRTRRRKHSPMLRKFGGGGGNRRHVGPVRQLFARRDLTAHQPEIWWRRRESNPATSIVWAPYRGGIAQNCATSEEKSAPSARNPVLRGTIAQPAWTKGTMAERKRIRTALRAGGSLSHSEPPLGAPSTAPARRCQNLSCTRNAGEKRGDGRAVRKRESNLRVAIEIVDHHSLVPRNSYRFARLAGSA